MTGSFQGSWLGVLCFGADIRAPRVPDPRDGRPEIPGGPIGCGVPARPGPRAGRMSRRAGSDRCPLPRTRPPALGAGGARRARRRLHARRRSPSAPSSTRPPGRRRGRYPRACSIRWSARWCSAGSPATWSAGCSWSPSSPGRTCWPREYVALIGTTEGLLPSFAAWLAAWGFVPYYVIVALVPLYFPDGTLPSPRWRPIARVLATVVVVGTLAAMLRNGPLDYAPTS